MFEPLQLDSIRRVVDKQVAELATQLAEKKVKFETFNRQYGIMVLFLLLIMSRGGSSSLLHLFVINPAWWLTRTLSGI